MDYAEVLRTESAKEFRLPKSAGEDNWKTRMSFCNNLSESITTYDKSRLPSNFAEQIEPYFNNILDCAASERTQLSNAGCKLMALLPRVLGRDLHTHIDRIFPVLLKLCASTKAVTAKFAAAAVTSIIELSTYTPRMLWHVCQVFEDKPAGPKIHGTAWLQTIMKEHHKHFHTDRDYEMISKAVLLALEDADATVRTNSRATYWTYNKLDSEGAQAIMEKLNKQAKTALQNDSHNPDKKSADKTKDSSRPQSSLAKVREERKKKLAQEKAQQQRASNETPAATQDSTEVRESRNTKSDKTKKDERPHHPVATAADDNQKHASKTASGIETEQTATTSHKVTQSADNEATKQTTSSRLLAAPIRRPRIVATPMNGSYTSRPASRIGQAAQIKDHNKDEHKEPPQDSRPTSSSNSKTAAPAIRPEKIIRAPPSPKAKAVLSFDENTANSSTDVEPHLTAAPISEAKGTSSKNTITNHAKSAKFIAEDKENNNLNFAAIQKTKENLWNTRTAPIPISPKKQSPQKHSPLGNHPGQISSFKPRQETSPLKHDGPPALSYIAKEITHDEMKGVLHSAMITKPLNMIGKDGHAYPDMGLAGNKSPSKRSQEYDFDTAYDFFISASKHLKQETLHPLGYRKLKAIMEQHSTRLIERQKDYDEFMNIVVFQLASVNELKDKKEKPSEDVINPVYNRQVLLQIITPLINNFKPWAQNWLYMVLYALILYRTALPNDGVDRRLIYCDQNINHIVSIADDPLRLIDSVVEAMTKGEETLTTPEKSLEPITEEDVDIAAATIFELQPQLDTASEPNSFGIDSTYNPYSIRSKWKHISECQAIMHGANMEQTMAIYMKKAINEHNIADLPTPPTKKLPFLIESGTSVITLILQKATLEGHTLNKYKADMLCKWAVHCMFNYNHVIKRAIVSYCQALYGIMSDDKLFFSYFEDEGQRNLLEYYLAGHRPL